MSTKELESQKMSVNYNYSIEQSRLQEFPNLKETVYVDHAGATLYSRTQLEAVHQDLMCNLYGNPHSHNASSKLATDTVDQIRSRLLRMFNTDHEEYSLIFTSGCTASLRIIADCFHFGEGKENERGVFCYLDDNHTSVQGMREVVSDRCSAIFCLNEDELVQALSGSKSKSVSESSVDAQFPADAQSLLCFPAQSNFSGRKYPLNWVAECRKRGLDLPGHKSSAAEKWYVLLDTAAFASTSPLDLSSVKPDFVSVSFYKMFGYPTGIGALLVHKRARPTLHKCYFGGGTVAASTAKGRFHAFWKSLHSRFEDGTVPFLNIISLKHGMDAVQRLAGGMQGVSDHVFAIAQYFYQHLSTLQHGNGKLLAEIYGGVKFEEPEDQGGVVTFNLCRANGVYIGYSEVDKFANLHDVHVRTGCFCNIGACQRFLSISNKVIKENFDAGHVCGDNMDMIAGRPTGAVRISFGYMSTIADARVCLRFIADSFLEKPTVIPSFPNPQWYSAEKAASAKAQTNAHVNGADKSAPTALTKTESVPAQPAPSIPKIVPKATTNDVSNVASNRGETQRTLTDIHLYPLKSCGAFKVSEWEMGSKGLLYDREWVLVTDAGVTIGQKRIPQICMLTPHIDLETRRFTLFFPGAQCFVLPLDQEEESDGSASFCTNKVCGDRVNTFDCGDAVADWLSDVLQYSGVRLLRQQSSDTRKSRLEDKQASGNQAPQKLSMANESQILLLNRASVRSLQAKIAELGPLEEADDTRVPTAPEDISEDNLLLRFRGNLVLDGGDAFEEEMWDSISIGDHVVKCLGHCTRCSMICMDQETAKKSREPLKTLSVWRGKKVPFGIHSRMLPASDGARQTIRVGDPVKVLALTPYQ
ncbi:molybdenum cofactor sulfurase [Plakobranchus ocellatus]|uniref:Molybdenum cofactor sulfurase n=1 Tax=Plakobranchus ocellatus TaxID=259542 RepID=A0AAV4BQQ8_9GAST|nr:molybdenum cofactor sulfurase [Plakobranchus ocellatus]